MLSAAQDGQFQDVPGTEVSYTGSIECRVYGAGTFRGADVYLCKLDVGNGGSQYEWGALVDGTLHTHSNDPKTIPTITGPWDPPW